MIYEPPQRVRPQAAAFDPRFAGPGRRAHRRRARVRRGHRARAGRAPVERGRPVRASPRARRPPTPAGPTPVVTFARPTPSPPPTFLIYRVQRGDTLNSLAKRFDTTDRSISWWNRGYYPSLDPESPGYDPNTIRVGWELNILRDTIVDDENPPAPIGTPRETPR